MPTRSAPVALAAITPRRTDRAVFVGQTGAGKTTLARVLLRTRRYVVAHDPKGLLAWPGYVVYDAVDRLLRDVDRDPIVRPRVIYRPAPTELRDESAFATLCDWVLARGRTTLYLDELYATLFRGFEPPVALWAAITRGREHHVEVWGAVQRPYRVPMAMLSEAEHYYVFRLRDEASRARIAETTGLDPDALRRLPKWDFYYIGDGDPLGPLRLDMTDHLSR